MNQQPLTVAEARAYCFLQMATQRGATCPCCDQRVKLYGWTLQSGMVRGLVYLLRKATEGDGWVHMNNHDVPAAVKESRSFPKLVHWGLVIPHYGNRGWWRATDIAEPFLRGTLVLPKKVYVYNDQCLGKSEELWSVHQAWGEHFDYFAMVHQRAMP